MNSVYAMEHITGPIGAPHYQSCLNLYPWAFTNTKFKTGIRTIARIQLHDDKNICVIGENSCHLSDLTLSSFIHNFYIGDLLNNYCMKIAEIFPTNHNL